MTSGLQVRHQLRFSRPATAAAVAVVGLGADLALDPTDTHVPLCPFRALTGLSCPLCGGLRSAFSLAHFDLATAVRDNLLFVVGLPLLLFFWLDWLRRDRAGRPVRRTTRPVMVAVCAIALTFTIIRNLPGLRDVIAPS